MYRSILRTAGAISALAVFGWAADLGAESVPFDSERWNLERAQVVEHLDRTAVLGMATLPDVDFENGVIEVDIAVDGRSSYPGVQFRVQSPADYERFYIRPHRGPLNYGDALQYTPVFNGIAGWQLYNGEGFTANGEIPRDRWVTLRVEVKGKQARFYWDGVEEPALVIPDLKHGVSRGSIGLMGPPDGSAYFSDFRYDTDAELLFDPPPPIDHPAGMIREWDLSRSLRITEIDGEQHPSELDLGDLEWEKIESDPSGLVDVARYRSRTGREPDCVYARATLHADGAERRAVDFGYSDLATIFLNGEPLFLGTSAYRQRDGSFLGIVGLFDQVYLNLKEGENELLFLVTESFGGWGFIARDVSDVYRAAGVSNAWETPEIFRSSESIVFDREKNRFYVSNYDVYRPSRGGAGLQAITTLSADGSVLEAEWASGLSNPTGMTIYGDHLYVVERASIAKIDRATGEIADRILFADAAFPNDIVSAEDGVLYVSDSAGDRILRIEGNVAEAWLTGGGVDDPNALCLRGDELLVGNNGDRSLKAIDLATKEVRVVARLGRGIIDGIKDAGGGTTLVSHWEGRLFRVAPDGSFEKILDTTAPSRQIADFEYVPEDRLVVVPTFYDNRAFAFRVE